MDADPKALEAETRAVLDPVVATLETRAGDAETPEQDPLAIGAWQQILRDLGFLAENDAENDAEPGQAEGQSGGQGEVPAAALEAFLAEAARTPEFAGFARARAAVVSGAAFSTRAGDVGEEDMLAAEALLEHVSDLLALDAGGEAPSRLQRRPENGEVSVWSRIVQARLERLGLGESGVGAPYGADDHAALLALARAASHPAIAESGTRDRAGAHWIGLSGDAARLLGFVRSRDPGGWLVVRPTGFGGAPRADAATLHIDALGRFAEAAPGPNGGLGTHRRTTRRPLLRTSAEALHDPGNRLGLRLVQIRLWQLGYYPGRIDGLYGPGTRAALVEAVETFCGQSAFGATVRRLDDGLLAINMHFLDEQVFAPATAALADEDAEAVDAMLAEAGEELATRTRDTGAVEDARDGLLERLRDGTRRVFATARRLVASALAVVRRALDRVADVVSRLVAPIRNLLAAATAAAAGAARRVARSITLFAHFLFGAPIGTRRHRSRMVTRFRVDRDAEAFAAGPLDHALVSAHRLTIERLTQALTLGLRIGGLALEAAASVAAGPFGWARLALRVLGLVRAAIGARIRRAGLRAVVL